MTSAKIVLFVTPSQDSTVSGIKTGLEKVLSRRGIRLQLVYTPFERRISDIKALVDLWHPVGVVAAISDFDVRNLRVPTVFAAVEHAGRRYDVVCNDSPAMGRLAADELGRLGDASYGYVSHPGDFGWSKQRGAAFREAVSANGKRVRSFRSRSLRLDDRSMVADFKTFVSGLRKPCGIFAANDEIAALTISVARELGLRVPDDVAVLGVDDEELVCENATPRLSSIRPDFVRAGKTAAESLEKMVQGGAVRRQPSTIMIHGGNEIVRRASTPAETIPPA